MRRPLALLTSVILISAVICATLSSGISVSAATIIDIDILHSDMWTGNNMRISDRYISGKSAISASPQNDASEFKLRSSFESIPLTDCSELVLSISLQGVLSEYDVSVILGSGEYRRNAYVTNVKCREIQKIYIPFSPEIIASLDYIEISVSGDDLPIYAILHDITADNKYTYDALERFDSDDIECTSGAASASTDGITVFPDSTGKAAVSMNFVTDTTSDGTYVVWLDASCSASGSVRVAAELNGKEVPSSKNQIVASGSHSNVFIIESAFSRVNFIFEELNFIGNDSNIQLTGAGVLYVGKSAEMSDIGSVISCKYENGRITVKGELDEKASLEYVDSKLGLYVIPLWENANGVFDEAPEITSGFSTLFTLYAEPRENYMNCMYQPVIVTDDENIPICPPVMPYSAVQGSSAAQTAIVYSVDHASPSGALEANADSEIIDIYVDRLLEAWDVYSASLYNFRGSTYYFDREYLEELSRRINFASKIGIRVYARLVCKNNPGLDFDVFDADSLERFCAVCDYLKSSFSGKIHGYIMGNALNTSALMSTDEIDKISKLAAVFTEALRGNGTAEIYLPFDAKGELNPFAAYAALRYSMAKYSSATVAMLYSCTDDPENAAASILRTVSIANSYGYQTDNSAVIWKAPANMDVEAIVDVYSSLCKTVMANDLRFATLDAEFNERNDDIYSILKKKMAKERISSLNAEEFNALIEDKLSKGVYSIRSFESSYDTTGWIAGGSFESVMTEMSLLKDGRALRTHSNGSGNAGMLAYRFDAPMDMSKTDAEISLGIASDNDGVAEVTIIFGCGESRREYTAFVEYNKPVKLICNMGDLAPVDYTAVVVKGSSDCTAELYGVSLHSDELTNEEMKDRYSKKQTNAFDPFMYVSIILVAAGTVAVFSVFTKRKGK